MHPSFLPLSPVMWLVLVLGPSFPLSRFMEANPRVFTLVHVVSASPTSTDIREVLIRLCRELKSRFPFIEWDMVCVCWRLLVRPGDFLFVLRLLFLLSLLLLVASSQHRSVF